MQAKVELNHINFQVENFKESVTWYRSVFGFKLVEEGVSEKGVRWGILRRGKSLLAISLNEEVTPDSRKGFIRHFGFIVEDQEAWECVLKKCGLKLNYGGPIDYPFSRSWYFNDPSGHEIEVSLWQENRIRFLEES